MLLVNVVWILHSRHRIYGSWFQPSGDRACIVWSTRKFIVIHCMIYINIYTKHRAPSRFSGEQSLTSYALPQVGLDDKTHEFALWHYLINQPIPSADRIHFTWQLTQRKVRTNWKKRCLPDCCTCGSFVRSALCRYVTANTAEQKFDEWHALPVLDGLSHTSDFNCSDEVCSSCSTWRRRWCILGVYRWIPEMNKKIDWCPCGPLRVDWFSFIVFAVVVVVAKYMLATTAAEDRDPPSVKWKLVMPGKSYGYIWRIDMGT
jgi:hypothetical protein